MTAVASWARAATVVACANEWVQFARDYAPWLFLLALALICAWADRGSRG